MLNTYAWQFFVLSRLLGQLHAELGVPLPKALEPPSSYSNIPGNAFGALGLPSGLGLPYSSSSLSNDLPDILTSDQKTRIPDILELLKKCCVQIDLMGVGNDIDRAITYIKGYPTRERSQFHIEHITNRIIDDIQDQYFWHVKSDKRQYYMQPELFGTEVGRKFVMVAEDIGNAGSCFALNQYTATVFHLMRVMEHCVQRFGKKLKAPIDVKNENWNQIMDHVNAAIKGLPGGRNATQRQKKRKEEFAMAAGRLDHVRIVWRNPVMHPKETYDEQQAQEVMTGVGKFLESIVRLV
jgi:hypothetical protein